MYEEQPHKFDAVVNIWQNNNKNYGMRITIENVDSCCQEHAEQAAHRIAATIANNLTKVWYDPFKYKIVSITQDW